MNKNIRKKVPSTSRSKPYEEMLKQLGSHVS